MVLTTAETFMTFIQKQETTGSFQIFSTVILTEDEEGEYSFRKLSRFLEVFNLLKNQIINAKSFNTSSTSR